MKKHLDVVFLILAFVGVAPVQLYALDQATSWTILPAHEIGATAFRAEHPTWDGRGVVLAILDTGVDPAIPGLDLTSAGQTKVIEVRDFTQEGEWPISRAEFEDGVWKHEDGLVLQGGDGLPVKPRAGQSEYPVYIGQVKEADFQNNSDVADFTDDGDRDDAFGFLVYLADRDTVEEALGMGRGLELLQSLNEKAAEEVNRMRSSSAVWLVVADTDGDGHLEDESILRDYHVNWDTFSPFSRSNPDGRRMMTWAVNVTSPPNYADDPPAVRFHFDSGAHGSHCAGIAAGFKVNGQEGLHGVAPGAWLMSMKIGDNNLSGGATRTESMKRAAEYAAEFGRRFDLPVVVNMSYGISSVEEGEDAIGKIIDEILAQYPNFYFCTSAGNEGPGLSSIGIPATSQHVISSGAFLPMDAGRDLYHGKLTRSTLFSFSSRGGETAKPDVVSPGTAMSTVPAYVDGSARFHGTSMASPQTAGAVACLISAAADRGLKTHWGMIKRALILGAVPQEGLRLVDQGGGLVNIAKSWSILEALAQSESAHQVLDYRISTECPFQDDGRSSASYWRSLGGVPTAPDHVSFFVTPVFHPDMTAMDQDVFFRSFKLKSDVSWMEPIAKRRYIRGDMDMEIRVQYDADVVKRPGVFCGRILATLEGGDLKGLASREFSLWNTIVNPVQFSAEREYRLDFQRDTLDPSTVDRYFVYVPAAASSMQVSLEVSRTLGASEGTSARVAVFDPEGAYQGGTRATRPSSNPETEFVVRAPQLRSGIWELDVVAGRDNTAATPYRMRISLDAYASDPDVITELIQADNAEPATAQCSVIRQIQGRFHGRATASLDGFRRSSCETVENSDTFVKPFVLDANTPSAELTLTMDESVANLFTDIAVLIEDSHGKAIKSGGFDGRMFHTQVDLPGDVDRQEFTLKIIGAFAQRSDMAQWSFELEERYLWAEPIPGEVNESDAFKMYCGVACPIDVSFAHLGPRPPIGMLTFGSVSFFDHRGSAANGDEPPLPAVFEIPIRLDR